MRRICPRVAAVGTSTVVTVSITVRAITPDEAGAFRRALRAGFSQNDTVDDDEWAKATLDPVDRVLAAFDGSSIVATFQSYQTELTLPGGATMPSGAVTAVTCRATHRRQGLLTRMMTADLDGSRDRGEAADVLIAAEYPIYGRFGYGPAAPSMGWELDANGGPVHQRWCRLGRVRRQRLFRDVAPAIFERVRAAGRA